MSPRPRVLLCFEEQRRSPVAARLYRALEQSPELDLRIVPHALTITEAREHFGGLLPHFVYIGFGGRRQWQRIVEEPEPYLSGQVLLMSEIADAQYFCRKFQRQAWVGLISVLVGRMLVDSGGYTELFASVEADPSTQYLQVPWGVDPELYAPAEVGDIDVAFICTRSNSFMAHENRMGIERALMDWHGAHPKRVVARRCLYGDEYRAVLGRSKISIVDTSSRAALTQKYVEGAASGALLFGDHPYDPDNLLEPGVSFVTTTPETLAADLDMWLDAPDAAAQVAAEGRRRVLERHSLSVAVQALTNYFHTTLQDALHEI